MDISNDNEPILSVSEFIEYINLVVGHKSVKVEGEISGYKVSQGKWAFFDLKDSDSVVSCFCLLYTLRMQIEDGMQVCVSGKPRVYSKSGRFSIFVDSVQLRGEGALKRAFELTKKKLEKEGLFAPERKRSLPVFPKKIGIVTSRESAAYSDFMRILTARWGGMDVYLYHVQVQGESAISEIVSAFEWFNDHALNHGIEAIALIRGGGSLEDLISFNSEPVVRAVFGSGIPVVCGVGHERDESLADYAADVRAATPTHAASIIVPDKQEIRGAVSGYATDLFRSLHYTIEMAAHGISSHVSTLHTVLHRHTTRLRECMHALTHHESQMIYSVTSAKEAVFGRTHALQESMAHILSQHALNVSFFERTLSNVNPLTVLARGYTMVRRKGSLITQMKKLRGGDTLSIQFSDGTIDVKTV